MSSNVRNIRILGMGKYLPRKKVLGTDLDLQLGLKPGTLTGISGVETRHFVQPDETNSRMGALAAMAALEEAHLHYEDIDALICTSGTYEQAIPCTAALIQKQLGKENSGTPCFDINSTCLSFVTGLDMISYLIQAKRYRKVLLIAAETASVGLNWEQHEACSLFGDGAAAAVIGLSDENQGSKILNSAMETYSSGSDTCKIQGGGTLIHPRHHHPQQVDDRFLFKMDGRKIFRFASEVLPSFMKQILEPTGLCLDDFKLVVPHQASLSGMELMRRRLKVRPECWMEIIKDHGNCIAASIPMALHVAIQEKRIERGDKVLLLGTSAGFSIGGIALEY